MPVREFAASFGRLAASHLWQSTGFAAIAVLLALALGANHARARYWLWLAASVKFLVPFALLTALGAVSGHWLLPARPVSPLPFAMREILQPFAAIPVSSAPPASLPAPAAVLLPALLLALWFCGFAAVILYRWARWRRVAAAVRMSAPLTEGRELETLRRLQWGGPPGLPSSAIRIVSSTAGLEPGVFGIFRPLLWLPAGIGDRLDDAELEAILAHELCHARRRDNLAAAIHMAVEAIFWFHPLVWWLGARLVEERERACDEEVVRMGGEPQVYAESILKVCEFYLASPVACAAGVTGGELKKRIESIMRIRIVRKLNFGKKLLLAAAAVVAVAGPIAVGVLRIRAEAQPSPRLEFEVVSIKASPRDRSGAMAFGRNSTPGTVTLNAITPKDLIARAYSLKAYQIYGPAWLGDDLYDIVAKAAGPASDSEQRLMLQSMLAGRFQLVAHDETRVLPVYELLIGKSGPKIHEVIPDDTGSRFFPGRAGILAKQIPMTRFADILSARVERPVLDRTGLSGVFDIDLKWTPDDAELDADSAPSIFTAVQDQLGLKLEAQKAPISVLVIDHIERPSGN